MDSELLQHGTLLGPGGEPYNLTKSPTDLGVWRRVGFSWTLSHDALRAQWPLAKAIRVFFPTFIPLGVIQRWRSPNGAERNFFRCVIAQSKPIELFETDAGTDKNRVHVAPPVGFPFPLPGPIVAEKTLVWWPPSEEGRTPGKYVDFAMYYEAMQQAVKLRDTMSLAKQHEAMMAELAREEKADETRVSDYLAERRKERRRRRTSKEFVPQSYQAAREAPSRGKPSGRRKRKP